MLTAFGMFLLDSVFYHPMLTVLFVTLAVWATFVVQSIPPFTVRRFVRKALSFHGTVWSWDVQIHKQFRFKVRKIEGRTTTFYDAHFLFLSFYVTRKRPVVLVRATVIDAMAERATMLQDSGATYHAETWHRMMLAGKGLAENRPRLPRTYSDADMFRFALDA